MKTMPIAHLYIVGLAAWLPLSSMAFPLSPPPNGVYSASVWKTFVADHNDILATATELRNPSDVRSVVLDCYAGDGTAVVRLTYWPRQDAAQRHLENSSKSITRSLVFHLASAYDKQDAPQSITEGDFVQWSEFLTKAPQSLGPLSEIVEPMTQGMVASQPTLLLTRELHSIDKTSLGLLALWKDRAGFNVFEENNTFGEEPYWAPYARNEHWMCKATQVQ